MSDKLENDMSVGGAAMSSATHAPGRGCSGGGERKEFLLTICKQTLTTARRSR